MFLNLNTSPLNRQNSQQKMLIMKMKKDIFGCQVLICEAVPMFQAGETNREQIKRMLDELARRPPCCFKKFIVALRKSSQGHCADFVQSIYSKNILSQDPSIHATMSSPIQASSDVETSSSSQKPSYSLQYRGNNPEVTNYLIAGPCAALPDIIMEEPESFKAPVQESTFRQGNTSFIFYLFCFCLNLVLESPGCSKLSCNKTYITFHIRNAGSVQ